MDVKRLVIFECDKPQTIYVMGTDLDGNSPSTMIDDDFIIIFFALGTAIHNIEKSDLWDNKQFINFETDGFLKVYTESELKENTKEFLKTRENNSIDSGQQVLILENFVGTLYLSAFDDNKYLSDNDVYRIYKDEAYNEFEYPRLILSTDIKRSGTVIDLPLND